MTLWIAWIDAVRSLRPACQRSRTFLWMLLALIGLCCRLDLAGVTSYVRVLGLRPQAYHRFLHLFHSKGLDLDKLTACWVKLCLTLFTPVAAGSRLICLADGIKAPKEGRLMPAVKSLHQQSASNSKPEYIMGHSCCPPTSPWPHSRSLCSMHTDSKSSSGSVKGFTSSARMRITFGCAV